MGRNFKVDVTDDEGYHLGVRGYLERNWPVLLFIAAASAIALVMYNA